MATTKKLLQAAAGNAGGALNVEDVFSTYLYDGNGASPTTITNDIDLSGEGGMVWTKNRDSAINHNLTYTDQPSNRLFPNTTDAADTGGNNWSYASNGYTVTGNNDNFNGSGVSYASWTFRKAPKFFDIVDNITMPSSGSVTVSHNLGSTPGVIFLKRKDGANNWFVYHRSNGQGKYLWLDTTGALQTYTYIFQFVTDTSFRTRTNTAGDYIAYLFAHNDGDGEFGPDGNADIIKCGSYTGNGSATGPEIDLGFEPQWVLTKRTNSASSWQLVDVMRGMSSAYYRVFPDTIAAEDYESDGVTPTATGFKLTGVQAQHNASGGTYIYIAIRRPTAVPESATEVFAIDTRASSGTNVEPAYRSPFPVDMAIVDRPVNAVSINRNVARLMGDKFLRTNDTTAEGAYSTVAFDNMNGISDAAFSSPDTNRLSWMWKRAPNYFDVVTYTGTGSARTVSHNLGVAPEMIWVKERDNATNWNVYHKGLNGGTDPEDYFIRLNLTGAEIDNFTIWNDTAPTDTQFTVGLASDINGSNDTYIAYLFATLAGISKVGSATHSGTTNVDCGFSSGARFVLLKRTDASGDWYIWDSTRGIVSGSGNDPYLLLNTTAAEVTNTDYIDPLSSGFTITSSFTAGDYIFYAIA